MPYIIGSLALVALGYATKQVGEAADTAGNAALKLTAAVALGGGAYYVAKRVL